MTLLHFSQAQAPVITGHDLDEQLLRGRMQPVSLFLARDVRRRHAGELHELVALPHSDSTVTHIDIVPYTILPPADCTRFSVNVAALAALAGNPSPIGKGQAYWYEGDQVLILWELIIDPYYRPLGRPADTILWPALWKGVMASLLKDFPSAQRIVTPSWEALYEREEGAWPEFLESIGYTKLDDRAYLCQIDREREEDISL